MAGMNATSRLEAKDNKIKGLKERITTLTAQLREAKAAAKAKGGTKTRAATSSRRPASPKARTGARARSAGKRRSVAPQAAA